MTGTDPSPSAPIDPAEVTIRDGVTSELPQLASFRRAMYIELHDEPEPPGFADASALWLEELHAAGRMWFWLAHHPSGAVGSAMLELRRIGPRYPDLRGLDPIVKNVFVVPFARRLGIARRLTLRAIEKSRSLGATRVSLHASDEGRPLYASLGFVDASEMRLSLLEDRP